MGVPVPWSDPCIQKMRSRIGPDLWIFENVVRQNASASLMTMSRMLVGFGQRGEGDSPFKGSIPPTT
jgi:hypothetical protein